MSKQYAYKAHCTHEDAYEAVITVEVPVTATDATAAKQQARDVVEQMDGMTIHTSTLTAQ